MSKTVKKVAKAAKRQQETGAKKAVMQEIFNDMYDDRLAVYRMNFMRGIFFGFGSVLGGTVVIALLIWILSLLSGFIPGLSEFFEAVSRLLEEPAEA